MVQKNNLNKIIIISGPTASGKTAFSLQCAHALNGEIISCDSMQIYQKMNIGTGKLPLEQRQGIPHFMIDIIPPNCEFSVSDYVKMSENIISELVQRGKTPIIVGGTGLYINGLLNGLNYGGAPKSEEIREKYAKILNNQGKEALFAILKKIDFDESQRISPNDTKRVIRAIEIFELTGKPKSQSVLKAHSAKYDYKLIALSPLRDELYANINRRVADMINEGLVDEVKSLYEYKDCQSMQAIGYKEIINYLDGATTLDTAVETIQKNSRHYAKRQITYLKHMDARTDIIDNYDKGRNAEIINSLREFLNTK